MPPVKVIIVEDEPLYREMLERSLSSDPAISIQGSFSNAADVLAGFDSLNLDVAVLDIQIEGEMNGYELALRLRRRSAAVGIVLLSNFLEYAFVNAFRRRAMSGWSYLLKDSATDFATLLRAVKGTARGDIILDPRIAEQLQVRRASPVTTLTEREREILSLIATGYSNRSIAELIGITNKTVENAINRIYDKMGIDSDNGALQPRVAAVLTYLQETRAVRNIERGAPR